MKISITGLDQLATWANKRARNMDQAMLKTLNRVAFDVRDAEYQGMKQSFDRPVPRTMKSLFVRLAKPKNLEAFVQVSPSFSGTPPEAYLNPEVYGGARHLKSTEKKLGGMLVPKNAPLDQYGNVRGSYLVKIRSQLKLMQDPTQNATTSAKSKKKRKAEGFFRAGQAILSRKPGQKPVLQLIILKRPLHYRLRLPFQKIADQSFKENFERKLISELEKASNAS